MKLLERVRPIDQVYQDLEIAEEIYGEINTQCATVDIEWDLEAQR